MALTTEAIVGAALDILDEFGLADLTMRRVGAALDVKAGALYWHFPNKQTLLAAVADEVLHGLDAPEGEGSWSVWLTDWAEALRARLLSHRDAAELVASTQAMGLGRIDPCAAGRMVLAEAGLDADSADATMQALLHLVLGHVVEEQTQSQLAALGVIEPGDPDRASHHFHVGVRLLIDGVGILIRSVA